MGRWPSPLQSWSFLAIIPVFGLNDLLNHLPELDYSTHSSFYKINLLAHILPSTPFVNGIVSAFVHIGDSWSWVLSKWKYYLQKSYFFIWMAFVATFCFCQILQYQDWGEIREESVVILRHDTVIQPTHPWVK